MALQHRSLVCDEEIFNHYFLCNYKPYKVGVNNLSHSLIRFKHWEPIDVQAWSDCASDELHTIPFSSNTVVLRALSNDETKVQHNAVTPMDKLGYSISGRIGGRYRPYLLRKRNPHPPLKSLTLQERIQIMEDLYFFQIRGTIGSILLVDDIFTSGTTMTAIIRAIRKKSICPISLFTLAVTDSMHNEGTSLTGASYAWKPSSGWIHLLEPDELYFTLEGLKHLINNDFQ